jgi:hypothetical protein
MGCVGECARGEMQRFGGCVCVCVCVGGGARVHADELIHMPARLHITDELNRQTPDVTSEHAMPAFVGMRERGARGEVCVERGVGKERGNRSSENAHTSHASAYVSMSACVIKRAYLVSLEYREEFVEELIT